MKGKRTRSILTGLLCLGIVFVAKAQQSKPATVQPSTSVLSQGEWHKICVESEGIYKISYQDLEEYGLGEASLSVDKIHVYGNGGGMLPQGIANSRTADLEEIAITVNDDGDGIFNKDDYLLFYSNGPHISTLKVDNTPAHEFNLYSNEACYFISVNETNGLRVDKKNEVSDADEVINHFQQHYWHELDEVSYIESGREWYGERMEHGQSQSFQINTKGLLGNTVKVKSALMAHTVGVRGIFYISMADQIDSVDLRNSTGDSYGEKGVELVSTKTFEVASANNTQELTFTFNSKEEGGSEGFINYYDVYFDRELSFYDEALVFHTPADVTSSTCKYEIKNEEDIIVWDISNPLQPVYLENSRTGNVISFNDESSEVTKYIAFDASHYRTPNYKGQVENQNLHGISKAPDLLIIYHPDFKEEVERLADFKREFNEYSVETANVFEIYNEFSSGSQDITAIRDFIKMIYDRGNDDQGLQYVLLFGDASYDYKDRIENNTNFIPIYEARQSLHNVRTYSSDDYYAFLEDHEGEWVENDAGNHDMEVAVGRFVCTTLEEAHAIVNKVITYASHASRFGEWRNKICLVADDDDTSLHMDQANSLANLINYNTPKFITHKIFLDAYQQFSTSSGEICPSVVELINEHIDDGTLIVNYTGHGGGSGWTKEQVLSIPQIKNWENPYKLPLFVTATCEFGRYDHPKKLSGAELLLIKENGGAIGLVTTTRPVFASSNFNLNQALYNALFDKVRDNEAITIGDLLQGTKNTPSSMNDVFNRNFSLLGDPSLELAIPKYNVAITGVFDEEGNPIDTANSMQVISIQGEVRDFAGNRIEDFNGSVHIKLFDKEQRVRTLGNEGHVFPFYAQEELIHKAYVSADSGVFHNKFTLPADMKLTFGDCKFSFYAHDQSLEMDASGTNVDSDEFQLVIGGTIDPLLINNDPPEIGLFIDDVSFIDGDEVSPTPVLIAQLRDENGINVSRSGIGHEIQLTVDGEDPEIVNDYYELVENNYQDGIINLPLGKMEVGMHNLELKAWDTHNNGASSSINFYIDVPGLMYSAYPNPFNDEVNFFVEQRHPEEELYLSIDIFDAMGQLVEEITYESMNAPQFITDLKWNLKGENTNKTAQRTYFYRIRLRYGNGELEISKIHRLAQIN